jgi:hypothetical protein
VVHHFPDDKETHNSPKKKKKYKNNSHHRDKVATTCFPLFMQNIFTRQTSTVDWISLLRKRKRDSELDPFHFPVTSVLSPSETQQEIIFVKSARELARILHDRRLRQDPHTMDNDDDEDGDYYIWQCPDLLELTGADDDPKGVLLTDADELDPEDTNAEIWWGRIIRTFTDFVPVNTRFDNNVKNWFFVGIHVTQDNRDALWFSSIPVSSPVPPASIIPFSPLVPVSVRRHYVNYCRLWHEKFDKFMISITLELGDNVVETRHVTRPEDADEDDEDALEADDELGLLTLHDCAMKIQALGRLAHTASYEWRLSQYNTVAGVLEQLFPSDILKCVLRGYILTFE